MKKREIAALCLFAAVVVIACLGVRVIVDTGEGEETELVNAAVKNAALTCYAVEGAYPADIKYLRDNYGLSYDEDVYLVVYDAFASNVMPSIRVLARGGGL